MSEENNNLSNNSNTKSNIDDTDQEVILIDEEGEDSQSVFIDDEDDSDALNDLNELAGLNKEFLRSKNDSENLVSNSNSNTVSANKSSNSNNSNNNSDNSSINNSSGVDDTGDTDSADDRDDADKKDWGFVNRNSDKEDTFDEVDQTDEFDEAELVNANRTNQNNNKEVISKPASNNKSSGFLSYFKKGDHFNFRSIGAIGVIGGFILAILFSMNSSKPEPKETKVNVALPEQSKMAENRVDTSELDPVATKYVPEERLVESALPVVTIPPVVAPAVIEPVKAEKPVEVEESKEFGIELRAGTEAALKTINSNREEKTEKGEEISLDGLTIQMILLEPFRSGISSLVKAQVIADVVNTKGEVLIRANSRVQVPFERFEVDGRVMNNSSQPAQVFLANGKKLNITGIVKGLDGFAGIKGKVKKLSKGNVFARVGKTMGRVGARVVGVTTGGFAGRGLEDTINESVDQNSGFIPNGRIVEVLPGTRFTFTASQL